MGIWLIIYSQLILIPVLGLILVGILHQHRQIQLKIKYLKEQQLIFIRFARRRMR